MQTTRKPAVAGLFYPKDPQELENKVDQLLEEAASSISTVGDSRRYALAIIAAHAGYDYSGPTAAMAYSALDPATRRVLIIGPTHRVGIEGMALTGVDAQETPLGSVPTDHAITRTLEEMPDVISSELVHAQEHSLEVHIPFLQRYLDCPFTVVPLAVGQASPKSVARVIETALGFPDTAVIVSSDLSHYLPYAQAVRVDGVTLEQIIATRQPLQPDQACGAHPISGMMHFAQQQGWQARVLDARNSGDTAGDKTRVVGYPALAWYPTGDPGATMPTRAEEDA